MLSIPLNLYLLISSSYLIALLKFNFWAACQLTKFFSFFQCPFHGRIIPRNKLGEPNDPGDVKRLAEQREAERAANPNAWEDEELQRDIEAQTGKQLVRKGKGKGAITAEGGCSSRREGAVPAGCVERGTLMPGRMWSYREILRPRLVNNSSGKGEVMAGLLQPGEGAVPAAEGEGLFQQGEEADGRGGEATCGAARG